MLESFIFIKKNTVFFWKYVFVKYGTLKIRKKKNNPKFFPIWTAFYYNYYVMDS